MSVSEREAESQVAEARESLQTMRKSMGKGKLVRGLALVAGFAVVVMYVYSFVVMARELFESDALKKEVQDRIEMVNPQGTLQKVVRRVGPVYFDEARRLVSQTDLEREGIKQLRLAFKELRPALQAELERVSPRLVKQLKAEAQKTSVQLQNRMQKLLNDRLKAIIQQQGDAVKSGTNMSEEELKMIMARMIEANQQALLNVVKKRWRDNQDRLDHIGNLVAVFPEMPKMKEAQLAQEARDVLLALLKLKLPDHQVDILPPGPTKAAVPSTISKQKLEEIIRQGRAKTKAEIEKGQKALKEAAPEHKKGEMIKKEAPPEVMAPDVAPTPSAPSKAEVEEMIRQGRAETKAQIEKGRKALKEAAPEHKEGEMIKKEAPPEISTPGEGD